MARAVRVDLRLGTLSFDLRLGDAAPVPRRFFFPPAMAVNVDGDIIDELGKQGRTDCLCSDQKGCLAIDDRYGWDEKGSQRAGCDIILMMWQVNS